MPYRTDLKRPDLKGQFPCSVCNKVFCHSSSLSRHRMQAHYKSYICTQCNQEIHSSETLRSHMYRCHQIQRMFMCRCCNWAFPDKTSLHIHMQSMQKSGKPGDVSVLARSSLDSKELAAAARENESRAHSFGSPSNSSPDDEEQETHNFRGDSISPSLSEMEEQQHHNLRSSSLMMMKNQSPAKSAVVKMEEGSSSGSACMAPSPNINGIFPNQLDHHPAASHHQADFLLAKLGIKHEPPMEAGHQQPGAFGGGQPQQQHSITPFQQQWLAQLLANNPYFAQQQSAHQQQQLGGGQSQNMKLIQSICSALATAAASNRTSIPNTTTIPHQQQQQAVPATQQAQQPPLKKSRRGEKRKSTANTISHQQADLSLQIPGQQAPINFMAASSPAMSEGSTAGKLNSLITNLLSIKSEHAADQHSPGREEGAGGSPSAEAMERKNKRKLRTPTRASEMTEIVYGDDDLSETGLTPQASAETMFPCIKQFMEKSHENAANQDADQQPSPAVSDSQTSGGSSSHGGQLASPKKGHCTSCQELKASGANGSSSKKWLENVDQIRMVAERLASLANSVQEANSKQQLQLCARQLQAILQDH